MKNQTSSKIIMAVSMIIFGTIGVFRKYILLPSAAIASARGFTGAVCLAVIMLILRKKPDFAAVKANLFKLILSGALIGFNWILLFEAYNYTTVAVATLCYYMAPVIVTAASPFILKEKMTARKWICAAIAAFGMVLVSNVGGSAVSVKGIMFGLGAAVLYSVIIFINKTLGGIPAYDKTVIQIFFAAVVVLPYTLFVEKPDFTALGVKGILLLSVMGILHTGIAYALYFGSMENIPAGTVAILSYVDPAVAVILSAVFLGEETGIFVILGTVLILGATVVSEIELKKRSK